MGPSTLWLLKHTEHVDFLQYVLEASLMMTPWGRNMYRCELCYKVVFDGYLFIPYFIILRHK